MWLGFRITFFVNKEARRRFDLTGFYFGGRRFSFLQRDDLVKLKLEYIQLKGPFFTHMLLKPDRCPMPEILKKLLIFIQEMT